MNLGQKNMLYSLKKIVTGHPYHSHLSKTATFFCPQGGRCGDCWTLNNAIVFGPFFPFYLNQKKKRKEIEHFLVVLKTVLVTHTDLFRPSNP